MATEDDINLDLHPDALAALDVKVRGLMARLHVVPMPSPSIAAVPDQFVAATIDSKDIKEMLTGRVTPTGRSTAIYFVHSGSEIGFKEEAYDDFVRLCESIQKLKPIRDHISLKNLTKTVFDWVKRKYLESTDTAFFDFALPTWRNSIANHEVWIPLCQTSVESEFQLGHVIVKPFRAYFFHVAPSLDPADFERKREVMEGFRRKLQGSAAATMTVSGDPERAYERAFEETERSIGALRFFSQQMLIPGARGTAVQTGIINPPTAGYFVMKDGQLSKIFSGLASTATYHWTIGSHEIKGMFSEGLAILHHLLTGRLTSFEADLLDSVLLYTRAATTDRIADRLMYVFSALESFLLRDDSEPLQQNIADRIAYFSADDGAKRREIIRNYKAAYALRSKYVHHGQAVGSDAQMDKFFRDVWVFYLQAILNHNRFADRKEMFEYIDKLKYG